MNFNYDQAAPVYHAMAHPYASHPLGNGFLMKQLDPVRFRKVMIDHKKPGNTPVMPPPPSKKG